MKAEEKDMQEHVWRQREKGRRRWRALWTQECQERRKK
jgi:hypothetical protein